ncbi:MAG: amidohydrolase family protein [Cyanobacteria bacterium CRU_2_1]|nr:amidohydrolase family protein [Cyanobacteria bacterium CRU_2_1]
MDLKIQSARLSEHAGFWDIAIDRGIIIQIASSIPVSAKTTLDANGKLVIPGLVDAHIHLDKALLLDRAPAQVGDFAEALRETLRMKESFSVEDIQTRARQVLEKAIAFGTTAMRSHVEVDPIIGLTGIKALLPLREEYDWGMTLQLAIFAQEGITNQPHMDDLLRQAMRMGGNAIGSAPYVDPQPQHNVQMIFDIAQEFNCDVDFHLDFLDDDKPLLLPFVVEETIQRGWQGRVCLGHMTKLAALPPAELKAIASSLRAAKISILALPASDLYMMSRKDTHNVRRGVAPVHQLAEFGVNVGLATNNIQNLFTPFGDGDVLKICTLLAQVLQMGTTASHQRCLQFATTQAAEAIGIKNYGVEVGKAADLIILDAESVSDAIGTAPIGRLVIKRGQPIVYSKLEQHFRGKTV